MSAFSKTLLSPEEHLAFERASLDAKIQLPSIEIALEMSEIYEKVLKS